MAMIPYTISYISYHKHIYDMCHGMMSYMMSCAYDVICLVYYDILYDIFTDSALFKCGPGPVQMQPRPGSNATRFGSNVGPARPESTLPSVCLSCIEIGLQWFITPYQASRRMHLNPPLPPPTPLSRSSCLGEYRSDFGARLYRSTSLRLMYTEYSASSTRLHLKFFKTPRMTSACASARPPGCGAFICSPSDVRPGGATTIRQAR